MALQFIDKKYIAAIIIDAWQNYLNTEKDPTSGKYFTSDPNNTGGLYGDLTDSLASALVYDPGKYFFTPHQKSKIQTTFDNRNGLIPEGKKQLDVTYSWQDSSTVEHSETTGITTGVTEEISVKATIEIVELSSTTTFSFEATHSWTKTQTQTKSESKEIKIPLEVEIPKGKAYQVVLAYNEDSLAIDYLANVFLKGTSWAFFETPVNGKKIHSLDAGTLCELIKKYGSAKDRSSFYNQDASDPLKGYISYQGKINAIQSHNFNVNILDVTANLDGKNAPIVAQTKVAI
ncbi:MAG: ETX/MTX2 family pore-forming toxin [Ginsengibacter sp.]